MKSKWVIDVVKSVLNLSKGIPDVEKPEEVLERVDKLLRRAMNSTDDENLHEDIRKEINGTD